MVYRIRNTFYTNYTFRSMLVQIVFCLVIGGTLCLYWTRAEASEPVSPFAALELPTPVGASDPDEDFVYLGIPRGESFKLAEIDAPYILIDLLSFY